MFAKCLIFSLLMTPFYVTGMNSNQHKRSKYQASHQRYREYPDLAAGFGSKYQYSLLKAELELAKAIRQGKK